MCQCSTRSLLHILPRLSQSFLGAALNDHLSSSNAIVGIGNMEILQCPDIKLAVLPRENEVNYDGHQVYRVHTGGDDKHIFDKLAGLQYEEWGHRKAEFIDISVPGGDADKLKHMGFNMKMMHGDLGKDIRKEKSWKKYKGKKGKKDDLPSDDWFDSYHVGRMQLWVAKQNSSLPLVGIRGPQSLRRGYALGLS
ncbi:hypothetical protein KC345_g272 [Hortaea werneckii]|nr:hypothetical protein KC345_g272 [Hortaea werneckii]